MNAKLYKPKLSLREENLPLGSAPCRSLSTRPIPDRTQFVVQSAGGADRNLLHGAHVRAKCSQSCGESPAMTFRC